MKSLAPQKRTLTIGFVLTPLLVLFVFLFLRSGPLAPVQVTVTAVENRALEPALFGIGTVEARFRYAIGPVAAGRLKRLDVQVNDRVAAGQDLGEMDPVDLDAGIAAQEAVYKRTQAQFEEASARRDHAQDQAMRYRKLLATHSTSEETAAVRQQELRIAELALSAAREDVVRAQAEQEALLEKRRNLHLSAPVAGLIVARHVEPGATVMAGQAVVELIDPEQLWINVRFDQVAARGLAAPLPATIILRSRPDQALAGAVFRVEPLADAITEEILAKISFDQLPDPLPPLGELAEVTVTLPPLPAHPVIANAAIRRIKTQTGVWRVSKGRLQFAPVKLGISDLHGLVTVLDGLRPGDQIVLHSERTLHSRSRIRQVDAMQGIGP